MPKKTNTYTAVLTFSRKEGWWTAVCAEVPAAISQGRTVETAKTNLRDAIRLVLKSQRAEILRSSRGHAQIVTVVA